MRARAAIHSKRGRKIESTPQPRIHHRQSMLAMRIANMNNITTRPLADGIEKTATLNTGDVFFSGIGCKHVTHPRGTACIPMVEKEGTI